MILLSSIVITNLLCNHSLAPCLLHSLPDTDTDHQGRRTLGLCFQRDTGSAKGCAPHGNAGPSLRLGTGKRSPSARELTSQTPFQGSGFPPAPLPPGRTFRHAGDETRLSSAAWPRPTDGSGWVFPLPGAPPPRQPHQTRGAASCRALPVSAATAAFHESFPAAHLALQLSSAVTAAHVRFLL